MGERKISKRKSEELRVEDIKVSYINLTEESKKAVAHFVVDLILMAEEYYSKNKKEVKEEAN